MKRVLGFLKYTQDYALHYNKYPAILEGYSDENWIAVSNEVKSMSGYVFTIGGGVVSWKLSKQTSIARSIMESESITLDKAREKAEWLWNLWEDISYWTKLVGSVCIHYDSQDVIDELYNVYSGMKTGKELWGVLKRKYKTEDAGTKKFFVARFLEFKMIDSKSIVSQVQELQVIIHDLLAEGMRLMNTLVEHIKNVLDAHVNFIIGLIVNEAFQVTTIIENLPPMWKDFKNYLKHMRKEMSVEDLIVILRIEEDNKAVERRSKENPVISGANIVEDDHNNSKMWKKDG